MKYFLAYDVGTSSVKSILIDEKGKTLRDYEIEIVNDELIITDENGNIIAYNPKNLESNRIYLRFAKL